MPAPSDVTYVFPLQEQFFEAWREREINQWPSREWLNTLKQEKPLESQKLLRELRAYFSGIALPNGQEAILLGIPVVVTGKFRAHSGTADELSAWLSNFFEVRGLTCYLVQSPLPLTEAEPLYFADLPAAMTALAGGGKWLAGCPELAPERDALAAGLARPYVWPLMLVGEGPALRHLQADFAEVATMSSTFSMLRHRISGLFEEQRIKVQIFPANTWPNVFSVTRFLAARFSLKVLTEEERKAVRLEANRLTYLRNGKSRLLAQFPEETLPDIARVFSAYVGPRTSPQGKKTSRRCREV